MRKFILNILIFIFFSVLYAIVAIFLPPRLWDAAVVLFCILIFLNKKPALIFWITLAAGLFFETLSNTASGILLIALFASLFSVYLLRGQFIKLNKYLSFILSAACATVIYRLALIAASAFVSDSSSGFFQTVYDFTDIKLLAFALIWNILLAVIFILAYNAARKRILAGFMIAER